MTKSNLDDRLFRLEQDLRRLRDELQLFVRRTDRARSGRQGHLAVCKAINAAYPTSGNVIPIVFVDASYPETLGSTTLNKTQLHADRHYYAKSLYPDELPAQGTVIIVWSCGGQWWTDFRKVEEE